MILSGIVLAVGWIAQQIAGGAPPIQTFMDYHTSPLRLALTQGIAAGNWSLLICYGGLLVLILLPLTRVLITALLFARSREYLMMAAALFVSITLIASFLLGIEA